MFVETGRWMASGLEIADDESCRGKCIGVTVSSRSDRVTRERVLMWLQGPLPDGMSEAWSEEIAPLLPLKSISAPEYDRI